MKKLSLLILSILFISLSIQAQDKIYKKNKEVIDCKIAKVGTKQIEYTQPNYNAGVVFTIDKSRVAKIVFESGSTIDLVQEYRTPEDYNSQKKNIIKFDFFSPLSGNLTLGYEHSLGLQKSLEMSVGIIGIGSNIYRESPRGVFFRLGYKLIRSPEVYFVANHYSHILKGFYVRPDIMLSYFSSMEDRNVPSPVPGGDLLQHIRTDNLSGALLINIGKQWIMEDKYSMSWFMGFGYGFATDPGYFYSHLIPWGNDFPIAFSAGLSFGILP